MSKHIIICRMFSIILNYTVLNEFNKVINFIAIYVTMNSYMYFHCFSVVFRTSQELLKIRAKVRNFIVEIVKQSFISNVKDAKQAT